MTLTGRISCIVSSVLAAVALETSNSIGSYFSPTSLIYVILSSSLQCGVKMFEVRDIPSRVG